MWYQSATFYEVAIHAFCDSNGDGIGDISGLTSKLDYLEWLGIDCVWLLPFFPSPMVDGGYDVSDLRAVREEFGTLEDLSRLLGAAHDRGMRVIADFLINHTSDQHPWFQQARRPGSAKRDWYVWSDTPDRYSDARIIFTDTQDSNWEWDEVAGAYFWHRFYPEQPDLNFDNPEVREEMIDSILFWLELGFDGLRLDAVPYLFQREGTISENLPETHSYLKEVRARVEERFPEAILLAEANQWPEDVVEYFGDGDECHMGYHFPVMPRLYMALKRHSARDVIEVLQATPPIPSNCQWGVFLRNHDELTLEMVSEEDREFMWAEYAPDPEMRKNVGIRRRLAPLLDNDRRRIELMHGLLLSLPGSPFLYYGDEIGMGDNYRLNDRDGVRTPMQWEAGPGAGFSTADPESFYLPLISDPEYAPDVVSVAAQQADPGSLAHWLRDLLAERKQHPALATGELELLESGDDAVLAFRRGGEVTVLANFSDGARSVGVEEGLVDLRSGEPAPATIELPPYGFRWLAPPDVGESQA